MIVLKNARYIDWETFDITLADVFVDKTSTTSVSLHAPGTLPEGDAKLMVIDCSGKCVTKAFGNGHHHIYSALARGMPAPKKTPNNFYQILDYVWWRLDKALTLDIIKASALFTAMECAKNGVTFVIDHHASPFAVEGSLETIAKAFDEVGVSHLLCFELSDRDGRESTKAGFEETESYLQARQGLVGLHASFTIGDETLKNAVDLAEKYRSGIHIHVAEDHCDQDDALKKYGINVVERLHHFNVLELPKSILVHCLHLSNFERSLIQKAACWVAQNTESNLNNNVGYFNAKGLNHNIMLGTDGMHSDMLRSAKATFFMGQGLDDIDLAEAYRRFRNVHRYLNTNGFSGDGPDNLVVFDYPTPTPLTNANFLGHFIYGLESKHIQHVISDGEMIVKDGKVVKINEAEVLSFAKEMTGKLWQRMADHQ